MASHHMNCTYENRHWSLVCVFILDTQYIVLRIDSISVKMDQNTRHNLEHIKWARTKSPLSDSNVTQQEDILIDITVPHKQDLQACGLRVLQYREILGNAVARLPAIRSSYSQWYYRSYNKLTMAHESIFAIKPGLLHLNSSIQGLNYPIQVRNENTQNSHQRRLGYGALCKQLHLLRILPKSIANCNDGKCTGRWMMDTANTMTTAIPWKRSKVNVKLKQNRHHSSDGFTDGSKKSLRRTSNVPPNEYMDKFPYSTRTVPAQNNSTSA
jgi:hypothetical protein